MIVVLILVVIGVVIGDCCGESRGDSCDVGDPNKILVVIERRWILVTVLSNETDKKNA